MVALTSYQQKMKILNWLEKVSAVDKIGPSKVGKIKGKYKRACSNWPQLMDFILFNKLELDLGRFCQWQIFLIPTFKIENSQDWQIAHLEV